jgi:hypothetical protein
MPPPTRANSAIDEAPIEKPASMLITRLNSTAWPSTSCEGVELPEVDDEQRAEADQAEADDAHAHHGAAAEGDRQRRRQAGAGSRRGAHVGAGGDPHAEEAGQAGAHGPGDERHADQPGGGVTGGGASRPAMMSTKIARTLYSAARKAMAPRKICSAIFCMRTVPGSCLVIQAVANSA